MSKKIALVTGGTGGIGTQICRRLADNDFFVIANHIEAEAAAAKDWREHLSADGYDFGIVAGDVSDFEDTSRMIQEVEEKFGPIDVLVNCAGITRDRTLRRMDPDEWQAVINTNLTGVFNTTRQVVESMLKRGKGRIINISSLNGQRGSFGQSNYSAAKAGVHGFTMSLAREVASKGITVNTVSPGYIITPMTKNIPDDVMEQIISTIPMRRMGNPDDVAGAVAFLTTQDADYITGADISVNGGIGMG